MDTCIWIHFFNACKDRSAVLSILLLQHFGAINGLFNVAILDSVTDFDSRVTVDVDFLLRKVPNTPKQLKKLLEEIIETPRKI